MRSPTQMSVRQQRAPGESGGLRAGRAELSRKSMCPEQGRGVQDSARSP